MDLSIGPTGPPSTAVGTGAPGSTAIYHCGDARGWGVGGAKKRMMGPGLYSRDKTRENIGPVWWFFSVSWLGID